MRIFNKLQGKEYDELTAPYEQYLPEYFSRLAEASDIYPEATENEEYNVYVHYNKWPIRKLEYSYVISRMKEAIYKGAKVLDAGCGVSSLPFLWNEFGGDITAVDFNEKSVSLMNKFSQDAFFGQNRHIKASTCDIMELPYNDSAFDVVVCISVLEHLPYPNYLLALNELYRVLKPGGTLVCTCDLTAATESKRRAIGAFSVGDIQKILSVFQDELTDDELNAEQLSITEEEIEQFWLQHFYEGIGYEGNRGYVAVGFCIKKSGAEDKKEQLLKYDELIQELINYESSVLELQQKLEKTNAYARELEREKEKLLHDLDTVSKSREQCLNDLAKVSEENEHRLSNIQILSKENEQYLSDLKKVSAENKQRLIDLDRISEESEQRLIDLKKVSEESEQRLIDLKKVSEESEQRLIDLKKISEENEQHLIDLKKVSEENEQHLIDLKKVSEESEQRLEQLQKSQKEQEDRLAAIEYLKLQIEEKDNIIKELSKGK